MATQFEESLVMQKRVQVESLPAEEDEAIIAARTRTFVTWINSHLKEKSIAIKNLDSDLESGVVLIKLLETLARGKRIAGRYYGRPLIKIQKVQNLMVAFRFLTEVEKIQLNNIKPSDVLEHNQAAIHTLLWILILHYQFNITLKGGVSVETSVFVLKRSFLTWINSVLVGLNVTNLSTDWKDGRILAALCEYCKPGSTANGTLAKTGNSLTKVQNVMNVVEKQLGIPQVIAAKDFSAEKPDERSVMMYLSHFVSTASSPGQTTLLQWIQQQIPEQPVVNLTTDWTDGMILGALTDSVSQGKFASSADMSPANASQNIEQSMIAAEKLLGVRRTVKTDEFADPDLDSILRMSYLSQFYHAKVSNNAPSLIPPAPDKVEVSQIQVPEGVGDGKHVWVQLDCSDAGYGTPRAEVEGRNVGSVPAHVNEIKGEEEGYGTDKYVVKFVPPEVDVYKFSIFYGDDHVPGSPFAVNLHPPNPEGVKHVETVNPSEENENVSLSFDTKEAGRGKLKVRAAGEVIGSVPTKINIESDGTYIITFIPPTPDVYLVDVLWGKFSAHAIGESTGPVALHVDQDKKSEYKVSFKPPNPDVYVVDVNWEGKPVPGSPFKIDLLPPPQPEEVECSVPLYSEPGEEADLLVDASNAGSGDLKAHCVGEKVGEVPVQVTKVEGRTYQVNFNPPENDLYTLNVLFDDKHVKGSPFSIDMRPGKEPEYGEIEPFPIEEVPDASKCVLLEAPPTNYISPVDKPISFTVDASAAGHAELDVKVDGPSPDKAPTVEVKERKDQKAIYDVTFVPHAPGPYTINLEWFGDSVPDTPLKCNAIDPAAMMRFPHGKPVGYEVDIDCKSSDLKAHAIHDKSGTQYKVKITKVQKGKHRFSFSPKEYGLYRLHYFVRDNEGRHSPIIILYEKPPTPEDVVVSGLGDECFVGEPTDFVVDGSEAGTGGVVVKATCPKNKRDKSKLTVHDNKDGTYTVTYVPQTIGEHNFAIQWASKPIPGSPFKTSAIEHVKETTTNVYFLERAGQPTELQRNIEPAEENLTAFLETETVLEIKSSNEQKDAPLEAVAVGDNTGPVDVSVTKPQDNVFRVALRPTLPDRYTLSAKLGEQDVPRSPISVTYMEPMSDPSKCKLIGVDKLPVTPYPSKPITFQVDTSEGGPGDLKVKVEAPGLEEPATVDFKPSKEESSIFNVSYVPINPGNHKFHVLWDGRSIPQSPVVVDVSEAPSYTHGQPIDMDINAECKQSDLSAHAIHLESNTQYKVKITKIQRGKFKLTLQPKDPGYYHVFMFVKQAEVPGSPFVVYYGSPPQPDKVVVRDISEDVYVGDDIHFVVDTSEAGSGDLAIRVSVPIEATNKDVRVTNNKDKTYSVEMTTTTPGEHTFNVLWGNESVPGAPFKIPVKDTDDVDQPIPAKEPSEEAVIPLEALCEYIPTEEAFPDITEVRPEPTEVKPEPTELTVLIGKALRLKVRPQDAVQRHGKIEVTVHGESTGEREATVSQGSDGVFEVYFNPDEPDDYLLKVELNGDPIPKSPFLVHYISPPEPQVTPLVDLAEMVFTPNKPVDYQLDLTGLDARKLSAQCFGEEVGEVEVQTVQNSTTPNKYKVKFTPPKPDLYQLSVFYDDVELKQSPYTIDLREKVNESAVREILKPTEAALDLFSPLPEPEPESVDEIEEPVILDELPAEEFTNYVGTPTMVKVAAKTEAYRSGTIEATVVGEKVGHVKVNSSKQPNDDTIIMLNPLHPDRYKVDITLDDNPVPRSPFFVNYIMPPSDPSQCRIIDVEDIPLYVETGRELAVHIDTKKAGPGDLDVQSDTPPSESEQNPSMLAASLMPRKKAVYEVNYIPNSVGVHKLNFLWANESIPNSPVQVIAYNPAAVEVHPHGKSVGADVTTDVKQGDLRAHVIHSGPGTQHKVKISKVHKGKYRFTFSPKEPGLYFLHIFAKDKEIPQSPIPIRYARPSKPEACVVIGLVDKCYLGETVKFVVDATQAGDGDLQTKLDRKDKGKFEITDETDATYSVEFTPSAPGQEKLHLTWGGRPIPGTPHSLFVRDHAEEELITWLFLVDRTNEQHPVDLPVEEFQATLAETTLLRIMARTSEQKSGDFVVTATDLSTSRKSKVPTSKEGDDIFEAKFLPDEAHSYSIHAKLNDEQVHNTPFIVNYTTAPPLAENCKIIGLENLPPTFQVNKPINFQVDTRLAGDGKLNIAADCPQTKPKLEAKASRNDPRIIDVEYVPTAPGPHHLKIGWSGEAIPDSPLTFEVVDVKVYPNGKPVDVDLDVDGKSSELDAYGIHVDTNTRLKVKTHKVSRGKFNFTLRPKLPGLYALHILLRKKEIPASPIYFRYDFPPKPEAVVISDVSEDCYLMEPYAFTVDASQAGTADLKVKVTSPSKGKDGELTVSDNLDGTHTVQHVPQVIGTHSFDVTWDGKTVPDSPVKVVVKKRVPVVKHSFGPFINLVPVGQPVQLQVVNVGKHEKSGFMEVDVSAPDNNDRAIIEKQDDGNYSILFTPTEPKDYNLAVKFHGEIEGSPVFIKAVEPNSLDKNFAHPIGICHSDVEVGQPACLLVPRDESLPVDTLYVENMGPYGPCETSVCDTLEGAYGLNFTPDFPGEYMVRVKPSKESEDEIQNSPFKVVAAKKESAAQKVFVPEQFMPAFADPIPLGSAFNFDIDTKDAGYGTLKVRPQGTGQADIKLYDQGNGVYGCEVKPREEGQCHLDILWKDESIRSSPFTLLFCKVKGVALEGEKFQTGTPYKFRCDCDQITDGQLEVTCSEPTAAEIQISPIADQKSYDCKMTPRKVGDYQVSVKYNGYHVEGSPFNVRYEVPPPTGVSFAVNAEGGETSDMSATVQSALSLEELPVQLSQLFGGQYSLEFVPTQGLEYLVTIKCRVKIAAEEKDIRGSPFTLSYVREPTDATKCVVQFEGSTDKALLGTQNTFFVLSEGAGYGQLNVSVEGPDAKPEVTVRPVADSKTEVNYVLHRSGSYHISVTWDGEHVPGSPFEVECSAPEGTVSLFKQPDFPTQITYGEPLSFSLIPKQDIEVGEGELLVVARSKMLGVTPGTVDRRDDGSYQCTLNLTHPGRYTVDVTWDGKPVEGTPFDIKVVQTPKPDKVVVEGAGIQDGHLGKHGNFTIDTTNAGSGTLSVNVEGPKGGFKINLTRHPDNDRIIVADYNPQHAGQYIIKILWSDVSVRGSPFVVNIKDDAEE